MRPDPAVEPIPPLNRTVSDDHNVSQVSSHNRNYADKTGNSPHKSARMQKNSVHSAVDP